MIRRATHDDASLIAALEATAAHHPWSLQQVSATLRGPRAHAWVLDGPPLVGHVLTRQVLDEAEILTIAVDPARRRQGLATRLLDEVTAHWSHHGVHTAFLEVRCDNVPALGLYRRRGWVDVGRRARYYPDGIDAALMRWTSDGRPP